MSCYEEAEAMLLISTLRLHFAAIALWALPKAIAPTRYEQHCSTNGGVPEIIAPTALTKMSIRLTTTSSSQGFANIERPLRLYGCSKSSEARKNPTL